MTNRNVSRMNEDVILCCLLKRKELKMILAKIYQIIYTTECFISYVFIAISFFFYVKWFNCLSLKNDKLAKLFGMFVVLMILLSYIITVSLFLALQLNIYVGARKIINNIIYPLIYYMYCISFSILLFLWTKYHHIAHNAVTAISQIINCVILLFSTVIYGINIVAVIIDLQNYAGIFKYQAVALYIPMFGYLLFILFKVKKYYRLRTNVRIFYIERFLKYFAKKIHRQLIAFAILLTLDICSIFIDYMASQTQAIFVAIVFPLYNLLACYCVLLQASIFILTVKKDINDTMISIARDIYSNDVSNLARSDIDWG